MAAPQSHSRSRHQLVGLVLGRGGQPVVTHGKNCNLSSETQRLALTWAQGKMSRAFPSLWRIFSPRHRPSASIRSNDPIAERALGLEISGVWRSSSGCSSQDFQEGVLAS